MLEWSPPPPPPTLPAPITLLYTISVGMISELRFYFPGELERARKAALNAEQELRSMQSRLADSMTLVGRCERKVALLNKECDGLKRIIAAYKSDETTPPGDQSPPPQRSPPPQSACKVVKPLFLVHFPCYLVY